MTNSQQNILYIAF